MVSSPRTTCSWESPFFGDPPPSATTTARRRSSSDADDDDLVVVVGDGTPAAVRTNDDGGGVRGGCADVESRSACSRVSFSNDHHERIIDDDDGGCGGCGGDYDDDAMINNVSLSSAAAFRRARLGAKQEAARQAAAAAAEARYRRLNRIKEFFLKRTILIVITVASFGAAAFLVVLGLNAQLEVGGGGGGAINHAGRDPAAADGSNNAPGTASLSSLLGTPPVPSASLVVAQHQPAAAGAGLNGQLQQGSNGLGGGGASSSSSSSSSDSVLAGAVAGCLPNGSGGNVLLAAGGGGGGAAGNVVTPGSEQHGPLAKEGLVVDPALIPGASVAVPSPDRATPNQKQQPAELVELTACPEAYGLQLYPHPKYCDQFYKCANGTLTLEFCENGLLFDGKGSVYNYCNYHWAVDCANRVNDIAEVRSQGCPYRFGIFPIDTANCATSYYKCAFGISEEQPCQPGLAYDNRIHQCNWPDLTPNCDPETIVGFRCPEKLPPGSLAVKFMPFPRFDAGRCDSLIVCVNGYPRLIRCTEEKVFNRLTLTCDYPENVAECANYHATREQP